MAPHAHKFPNGKKDASRKSRRLNKQRPECFTLNWAGGTVVYEIHASRTTTSGTTSYLCHLKEGMKNYDKPKEWKWIDRPTLSGLANHAISDYRKKLRLHPFLHRPGHHPPGLVDNSVELDLGLADQRYSANVAKEQEPDMNGEAETSGMEIGNGHPSNDDECDHKKDEKAPSEPGVFARACNFFGSIMAWGS